MISNMFTGIFKLFARLFAYVRMFSALTWLQDDLIVSGQLCASTDYEVSPHSFVVFLAVTDHFHRTLIDLGTAPPPLSRC